MLSLPSPSAPRMTSAPNAPSPDEFPDVLRSAHAIAQVFLAGLPTHVAAHATTSPIDATPPDGIGTTAALAHFATALQPRLSGSAGPRYFGFVTGGATPAALAGDWLTSTYDQNVSNAIGSIAADLEQASARAIARMLGVGDDFHGVFVSGATAANTVALATARQWAGARAGHDVAESGMDGAPSIRVLGGSPHASVAKAMAILGLGRAQLAVTPRLAGRTAVDVDALDARLREQTQAGHACVVVASVGEVNTGDIDDLAALAAVCRRHGAWLHIDGAFGLFAALLPERRAELAAATQADSITVDLHKWMNVPYDSALVYTRHAVLQRQVFRASAVYLGDNPDPLHLTPENSRRLRALPAWMSIAAYGRDGIARIVQRNCALARRLGDGIAAMPAFELLDAVRLNIVCFALRDGDAAARDALLARLQADGRAFMTPTVLFGRPAIRAAISNWMTSEHDIDLTLAALRELVK
jgi:glutamate/tyrosine decarboxylase-like PLP-dependent enzyme